MLSCEEWLDFGCAKVGPAEFADEGEYGMRRWVGLRDGSQSFCPRVP